MMITRTCRVSGKKFVITAEDLGFYAKMEIISAEQKEELFNFCVSESQTPKNKADSLSLGERAGVRAEKIPRNLLIGLPTLRPEERQRRRLAWRNERKLYARKCDLCEKNIISIYDKNAKFPVYCQNCWWSDKWDAKNFSRDFDFSRPFFEQFAELQKQVPKLLFIYENNENCKYVNLVGDSKNCYLIFGSAGCEDCYYGSPYFSTDCVDTLAIQNSELCYECLDSNKLYNCTYCQNCSNSNDLHYCYDVSGSNNCLCCAGLRKAEYCILNKQYSRENYEKILKTLNRPEIRKKIEKEFKQLKKEIPHKFMNGLMNENVSGDYLFQCKNAHQSFNCENGEDLKRVSQINKSKDIFDTDYGEYAELVYENTGYFRVNNCLFSHWNWVNSNNLTYCSNCSHNVKDCFGCVGLKHAQYCILNKQYTREEYEKTREKIIEHMKKTGEWGEFFPIELSPFAYNETVAQEYFSLNPNPLTPLSGGTNRQVFHKNPNLNFKYKWKDKISRDFRPATIAEIPDDIADTDDSICREILACENCQKNYQIQKPELRFYRKMNLPIPRKCPDCRHIDRMKLRNPRKLFARKCADCGKDIQTTFAPNRPEKVLCEECYLKVVK